MNTTYLFVPFCYKDASLYEKLMQELCNSNLWNEQGNSDTTQYLLKYVTDNFYNRSDPQCYSFKLNDAVRSDFDIADKTDVYKTEEFSYKENTSYRFFIDEIGLFCFSTSVCIMTFKLAFEENDTMYISNALFNLKRMTTKIFAPDTKYRSYTTILDMAKSLMARVDMECPFEFFHFADEGKERANVLAYVEVSEEENYDFAKELFYLRHCYDERYSYFEQKECYSDSNEIICTAKGIRWGVSAEAAACLVNMPEAGNDFITNIFRKNFNEQYLFMYILLLHQKYVLYMFLSIVGIRSYKDKKRLEEYRNKLYEFEADFVYSRVTEVPQYEVLYEKIYEAFALKEMYADVHEPLVALSEIRRQDADERQNRLLTAFTLLTVFSVMIDGFELIDELREMSLGKATIVKFIFGFIIVAILVANYWWPRRKK